MNYEHYNRSLDKHIKNKRHYLEEMRRQNMVSKEEGDDLARGAKEKAHKDYELSKETRRFLYQAKGTVDKNGKIKLSGRQLQYMEKIGVSFKRPKERPLEGGWE